MKQALSTTKAPGAVGPYSQAIRHGDLLFVSGQLPLDPLTGQMPEGVREQTRRALENVGAILREASLDFADVLKATVYLLDMDQYQEFNKVYATFFGEVPPARACVQVKRLPKDALVEVEVIAGY